MLVPGEGEEFGFELGEDLFDRVFLHLLEHLYHGVPNAWVNFLHAYGNDRWLAQVHFLLIGGLRGKLLGHLCGKALGFFFHLISELCCRIIAGVVLVEVAVRNDEAEPAPARLVLREHVADPSDGDHLFGREYAALHHEAEERDRLMLHIFSNLAQKCFLCFSSAAVK